MKVFIAFLLGILIGMGGLYFYQQWQLAIDAKVAAPAIGPGAPEPAVLAAEPAPLPEPSVPRQAPLPMSGVRTPPSGSALAIPVLGIGREQLVDTFNDSRSEGRVHDAIDIMAPAGTPVVAVADGTIEKLFESERGGLTIYQFEPDGRLSYYYAHLQSYAEGLQEGQQVKRGQVIGFVGSTGNADPSGPHLHFAVFVLGPERKWSEGEAINPYPLLTGDSGQVPAQ